MVAARGGACPDCILIPETACIAQNQLLSRAVLAAGDGVGGRDHGRSFFNVNAHLDPGQILDAALPAANSTGSQTGENGGA